MGTGRGVTEGPGGGGGRPEALRGSGNIGIRIVVICIDLAESF